MERSMHARYHGEYEAAGSREAGTIVLLHGASVTRKMWQPQFDVLAADFRLIAPDLPRYGALADVPFTLSTAVREVAGLIRTEAPYGALVVGSSLGGYTAIVLAAEHPELVAGLVLSGAATNLHGAVGSFLRITAAGTRMVVRVIPSTVPDALTGIALRWSYSPQIAASICTTEINHLGKPEGLAALAGHDFSALLARYDGPVLLLNGERDRVGRLHEATFLTAGDVRRTIVSGAGHVCSLERPRAFTDAVRAFAHELSLPVAAHKE